MEALRMRGSGRARGTVSRLAGDARLSKLAAAGDPAAFAAIFERYQQPLYRYCRSIVGNDEDARDALQSTMAAALSSLPGEARNVTLKPWLYRVAHNEAISILRRRTAHDELTEETPNATTPSAHSIAGDRDELRKLIADLRQLSDSQRGTLIMHELSGLSYAEIAQVFGITVGAAKQSVYKARLSLQELADGREMECDAVRQKISAVDGRLLAARKVRAHLRACEGCRDFRTAMRSRAAGLEALAPPLAAPAAVTMLSKLLEGGTEAGAGAAASAGPAAGLAGGGGWGLLGSSAAIKTLAIGAATVTIGGTVAGVSGVAPGIAGGPAAGQGAGAGGTSTKAWERSTESWLAIRAELERAGRPGGAQGEAAGRSPHRSLEASAIGPGGSGAGPKGSGAAGPETGEKSSSSGRETDAAKIEEHAPSEGPGPPDDQPGGPAPIPDGPPHGGAPPESPPAPEQPAPPVDPSVDPPIDPPLGPPTGDDTGKGAPIDTGTQAGRGSGIGEAAADRR